MTTPIRDCTLTTEEVLGRMRFAVLQRDRREVTVVHGSHPAPDHPTVLCYDGTVIGHNGEEFTYEADSSTGGTFLQAMVDAGRCEVTRDPEAVLRHLLQPAECA